MTDIVLNLFFFISKIVGNTNSIPLGIILWIITLVFCFSFIHLFAEDKIIKGSMTAFLFLISLFTFIPLTTSNAYPSNITYEIKENKYTEIPLEYYSIRENKHEDYIDYLSERAINKYVATIKYGSYNEIIDVVKVNKKYNKPDNVKNVDEKYLTAKLKTVTIMPVTVTTDWHGIKETYKKYQVEETYDYQLDQNKVSYEHDKEKLKTILN